MDSLVNFVEKLGYDLNVYISADREKLLNILGGGTYDGFFLFDTTVRNEDILKMDFLDIKTVFLDRKFNSRKSTSVIFDSFDAGYKMGKYLINMGHKKISFVAGFPGTYDSDQRFLGLKSALNERSITIPEIYYLQGLFEEEASYNAVISFLRKASLNSLSLPSVFVGGNDISSIGIIKALNREGYSVPKDISVTGFDDIEISRYFSPKITTYHNPIQIQAKKAVESMKMLIDGNEYIENKIIPGELTIRNSVKPIF
ncbi:LacI family DNA-binding transcriptional regulator [Oenococcus alcoholitolerans]|uniref:LacI family DNA-binding transcriptional regulator n=1 Tax=Oenococcus alcoholitolerans TaxID=931074 RepID=UPI003F70D8EC